MLNATKIYSQGFDEGIKPDPIFTVSKWADKYRILPRSSAEPGKWRTSRTPYLKEPMDCLSPSCPVRQVKVMKGTQLGWTEAGNNWLGSIIHLTPGPAMMVLPTCDSAKDHSKQKLMPSIKKMPVLRERIKEVKSREAGSTMTYKEFIGGFLILTGANSGVAFRHKSIKFLFLDDIDGYPTDVDGEGDPVSLAENRTDAFGNKKKIYKVSTPTVKGVSRIEKEYDDSDQREYYVPCPFCDHMQSLRWSNIKFKKDDNYKLTSNVVYECEKCKKHIEELHKTTMLARGKWVAQNPEHEFRGYRLSSLYSPVGWVSWKEIVKEFLKARKTKDKTLLQNFINNRLAEVWDDEMEGEKMEPEYIYVRRERYGPEIPMEAALLTCGVDVQGNRIEAEVIAWGKMEESWGIEYKVFAGDPSKYDVWNDLDMFLLKEYRHASGSNLKIAAAGLDTGGHHTQQAYTFVKRSRFARIYGMKGSSVPGNPIITKRLPKSDKPYMIGTIAAKEIIYYRLKIKELGPGFMHFPMEYEMEYFKQLVAEKVVTKFHKGVDRRMWVKPPGRRNEALDIRVYALAALEILKMYRNFNLDRLVDNLLGKSKQSDSGVLQPQPRGRRVISRGIRGSWRGNRIGPWR